MTEILFYHLQRQPLERVLPALLEKSLERGWRVVVQAASEERVEALDAHLWTYRDDSFLPHGTWREAEAREQPILLTVDDDNPNGAAVRFLVDGAPMPADAAAYERIVLMFDGEDPDAVAAARAALERGAGRKASTSPIGRPDETGPLATHEVSGRRPRHPFRRSARNEKAPGFARGLCSAVRVSLDAVTSRVRSSPSPES